MYGIIGFLMAVQSPGERVIDRFVDRVETYSFEVSDPDAGRDRYGFWQVLPDRFGICPINRLTSTVTGRDTDNATHRLQFGLGRDVILALDLSAQGDFTQDFPHADTQGFHGPRLYVPRPSPSIVGLLLARIEGWEEAGRLVLLEPQQPAGNPVLQ